jgi:hypothetical protein
MAVTDVTSLNISKYQLGIQITKVTDTSADWASVANSTYFYDKGDQLVHYKDSGGSVLELFSAAGGLTYFTEAQSTTSPNTTVNVDSLTAVASTTNADFAIIPKGAGAILADIPDNTGIGGNKRGQYAVDLQMQRNSSVPSQVASGNHSIIVGGFNNCATTDGSIAIGSTNSSLNIYTQAVGYGNSVNGQYSGGYGINNTVSNSLAYALGSSNTSSSFPSYSFGGNNTSSGLNSTSIGQSNIASGGNAIAIGKSSTAAGTSTVAIGDGNTSNGYGSASVGTSNSVASQDFNYAFGYSNSISAGGAGNVSYALALGIGHVVNASFAVAYGGFALTNSIAGRHSFSSNRIATPGDAQKSIFIYRGRTTNDVLTTLATDAGNSINSTNSMQLSNNSAYRFKGTVIGKQSGSVNVAAWDVDGLIVRGASAAATTLVVGNVNLVSNTPAWGTPVLSAFIDAFNGIGALRLQIQGAAATNIQWTATLETTEVIYA